MEINEYKWTLQRLQPYYATQCTNASQLLSDAAAAATRDDASSALLVIHYAIGHLAFNTQRIMKQQTNKKEVKAFLK
ncbi:unnamed protein product [Ceratitis capitata]|uniref:(Mediterranean fruit fly) hypothetical protein n=1 Tax=Ceratitis capitata TaxID=7213 RepID=A0A811U8H9_CERCA|nr:unnamed protein product [Ceratitis capitata]